MYGKKIHAAKCSKSREMTTAIDLILDIEKIKQQYIIIKGFLNPERLKQHIFTIGIDY